jgi:hypothetical protein
MGKNSVMKTKLLAPPGVATARAQTPEMPTGLPVVIVSSGLSFPL